MSYQWLSKIIFVLPFLMSTTANAQTVYKCVDTKGRVTFSDEKCSKESGVTASQHNIRINNSPIKTDAWRRTPHKTVPSNSGTTNQRQNTSNTSEITAYEKKLQFQKEQLTREVRKRPAVAHMRGRAVRVIDCQPRNRKGLMAAQEIVADWQRSNPDALNRTLFKHSKNCAQ